MEPKLRCREYHARGRLWCRLNGRRLRGRAGLVNGGNPARPSFPHVAGLHVNSALPVKCRRCAVNSWLMGLCPFIGSFQKLTVNIDRS